LSVFSTMLTRENPSTSKHLPKVGLALGGGVVRGIAHLGVVSVLQAHAIPIDIITGASVGSLIGGLFACGMELPRAYAVASRSHWGRLLRLVWPLEGFFSMQPLEDWLKVELGDHQIQNLPRRYAAVTTDLDTGEKIVLTEGCLATAIRASCSVPGVITPLRWRGRYLGDGSLVDAVPVSVARSLGADYVIGVDILTNSIRDLWGAFGFALDGLEILVRKAGNGILTADMVITPQLSRMTYLRFSQVEKLYTRGVIAAQLALPTLVRDLVALGKIF